MVSSDKPIITHVDQGTSTPPVIGTEQFTAGVDYRSGTSGDIFLHTVSSNDSIATTIRVRTIGLIHALSYKF